MATNPATSTLDRGRQTLPAHVAAFITEGICGGRFVPGERVLEPDLATEIGVSRTPVREALRILETQGLVRAVGGVGFVVRQLSVRQIDSIYDVRGPLESHAAAAAARLASDDDVWELERILDRAEKVGQTKRGTDQRSQLAAITESNLDFHMAIAAVTRNEFLEDIIRRLSVRPLVYRALYWYTPEQRRESNEEHRAIFTSIQARTPKQAAKLMHEHTIRIGAFMHETLDRHPELVARES